MVVSGASFTVRIVHSECRKVVSVFYSRYNTPVSSGSGFYNIYNTPGTNTTNPTPRKRPRPRRFIPRPPITGTPGNYMTRTFRSVAGAPNILRHMYRVTFLPTLVYIISILILFVPIVNNVTTTVNFLTTYVTDIYNSNFNVR